MATQEQMWESVKGTLDEFSSKMLSYEMLVKEQNLTISTQQNKIDILNTQLGGMQARIGTLETQMNAIAYQQAEQ